MEVIGRDEFISKLTVDPFNQKIRFDFARFLLASGDLDSSIAQLKILTSQDFANEDYKDLLKQCQDLLPKEMPSERPVLHVVHGSAPAAPAEVLNNVKSIAKESG